MYDIIKNSFILHIIINPMRKYNLQSLEHTQCYCIMSFERLDLYDFLNLKLLCKLNNALVSVQCHIVQY
jgi:hypothetical protein